MPEPFGVTIGIAGIILIGLIFTAINLVQGAVRFIGLGLLGFLTLVLLNRAMSPSGNLTYPGSNPSSPTPPNSSPNFPGSSTPSNSSPNLPNSSTPPNSSPNFPGPDASTSPSQRSPSSFSFDSASKSVSDFAKSVLKGLDEFVYGDPYAIEPPSDQPADGQLVEPDSSQTGALPEQQGYQIRPDGVPSRVSTLVVPDSGASSRTSGAATPGAAPSRTGAGRPVSAWW